MNLKLLENEELYYVLFTNDTNTYILDYVDSKYTFTSTGSKFRIIYNTTLYDKYIVPIQTDDEDVSLMYDDNNNLIVRQDTNGFYIMLNSGNYWIYSYLRQGLAFQRMIDNRLLEYYGYTSPYLATENNRVVDKLVIDGIELSDYKIFIVPNLLASLTSFNDRFLVEVSNESEPQPEFFGIVIVYVLIGLLLFGLFIFILWLLVRAAVE